MKLNGSVKKSLKTTARSYCGIGNIELYSEKAGPDVGRHCKENNNVS